MEAENRFSSVSWNLPLTSALLLCERGTRRRVSPLNQRTQARVFLCFCGFPFGWKARLVHYNQPRGTDSSLNSWIAPGHCLLYRSVWEMGTEVCYGMSGQETKNISGFLFRQGRPVTVIALSFSRELSGGQS